VICSKGWASDLLKQGEALLIVIEVTASQNIMVIMVLWSCGITKEHCNTIILISTLFCDRLEDGKKYKY